MTRPPGLRLGAAAPVAALLPLTVAVGLLLDFSADAVRDGARRLHSTVASDVARSVDEAFEQAHVANLRWKWRHGVEIRLAVGVNIAARLERVAGPMQILAAGATVAAAGEHDAVALGPQDVAGVARAVDVFVIEVS